MNCLNLVPVFGYAKTTQDLRQIVHDKGLPDQSKQTRLIIIIENTAAYLIVGVLLGLVIGPIAGSLICLGLFPIIGEWEWRLIKKYGNTSLGKRLSWNEAHLIGLVRYRKYFWVFIYHASLFCVFGTALSMLVGAIQ